MEVKKFFIVVPAVASIGLLSRESYKLFDGNILLPISLVFGALVYLFFFNQLFPLAYMGGPRRPEKASKLTKEAIFGISIGIAAFFMATGNMYLSSRPSNPVTLDVVEKTIAKRMHEKCHQVQLSDNSTHCVATNCWAAAVIGHPMTISPTHGIFSFKMYNSHCEIPNNTAISAVH